MSKTIEYGKTIKLDKKDKNILRVLQYEGRNSIATISKKTGIPRDSVMYRINRMKKLKVIRFFHVVLNPSFLGYEIYSYVNFTLHNLNAEKEKRFLSYLKLHPNVTYIAKTTGKQDFVINLAARNLNELNEIITRIRMKFSDIIRDYETSSIIQEHKYDYMVDLIK